MTGLDPPLLLYFPRLCWRTFLRLLGFVPPCTTGCEESLWDIFFSRESIIWWYVVVMLRLFRALLLPR